LAAGTVVGTPIRSSFSGAAACSAVPAYRVTAWLSGLCTSVVRCAQQHGAWPDCHIHQAHTLGRDVGCAIPSKFVRAGWCKQGWQADKSSGAGQWTVVLRARASCLQAPAHGFSKSTFKAWKEHSRQLDQDTPDSFSAPHMHCSPCEQPPFWPPRGAPLRSHDNVIRLTLIQQCFGNILSTAANARLEACIDAATPHAWKHTRD
jgi:hypothetical protein